MTKATLVTKKSSNKPNGIPAAVREEKIFAAIDDATAAKAKVLRKAAESIPPARPDAAALLIAIEAAEYDLNEADGDVRKMGERVMALYGCDATAGDQDAAGEMQSACAFYTSARLLLESSQSHLVRVRNLATQLGEALESEAKS